MVIDVEVESPPATRLRKPSWFDLRLIIGLALVLGSVAVGARVIAAADDTAPVLVAASDIAAGQPLTDDLVETRNVALNDVSGEYFTGPVGHGYVTVRPVSAGELVPRAAVASADQVEDLRYVTLPIARNEAPQGLAAGALVDVWVTGTGSDGETSAIRLAEAVSVTGASGGSGSFGDSSAHVQVTLALAAGDDDLDELTSAVLAAARSGEVYLAMLPGRRR
jgi:Flp pilus assembly protein CpaB